MSIWKIIKVVFVIGAFAAISALCYHMMRIQADGDHVKSGWPFIQYCAVFCVPFLFLTVVFPLFCILLIIINKPISEHRRPTNPTSLSKGIFFISLFFFLLVETYFVFYFELRMHADATGDIIGYSSQDIFYTVLPGTCRVAYILNKVVLSLSFMFHLPMPIAGRVYCLSDACFHLFIALSILFFTRRYDLAAVVLAAPVLILGINYYYIFNELFLSGSLMVLYMAVYKGLKDGPLKYFILVPCLVFIIWSHPVMIMVLFVFLAGSYKSYAQVINDKWLLLFILLSVGIRLSVMDGYDHQRLNGLKGNLDMHRLVVFIREYCLIYWYIVVLAAIDIYISYSKSKSLSDYSGLIILPFIVYFCAARGSNDADMYFTKFTYPVNLFILGQSAVLVGQYGGSYKKQIMWMTGIILLSGIYTNISPFYQSFEKQTMLLETLNSICVSRDPNQSKWYLSNKYLNGKESGIESIPFSAYQKLPITLQVVIGDETEKKILDTISRDRWLNYNEVSFNVKSLNPYYFHLKAGPYKELILDSATLALVKKLCQ